MEKNPDPGLKINRAKWSTKGYSSSSDERENNIQLSTEKCKRIEKNASESSNILTHGSGPLKLGPKEGRSAKTSNNSLINHSVISTKNITRKTINPTEQNSIERLTSEVHMLRQRNEELVGRLDDTSIRFEEALRKGTERKKRDHEIIEKKDELIRLLQQENDAYAYVSNKGSDRDSYKSSLKRAVIANDNEIQFKSLADAYAAKDSIKDCYSTYSNLIGSAKNDRTNVESKGSHKCTVMELETALKQKIEELELLKKQDAANFETIHKLRQLVWCRGVDCDEMRNEKSRLLAQIKAMQDDHIKMHTDLAEAQDTKINDVKEYHNLRRVIVEYQNDAKELCQKSNVTIPMPSGSRKNASELSDPKEILKFMFSLIKMLIEKGLEQKTSLSQKQLMKKIREQANEKHALQNEIKTLKEKIESEKQETQLKEHTISLEWADKPSRVHTIATSSHDISILAGKISPSSSDSAYGKDISGDQEKVSAVEKDNLEMYDYLNQVKESVLTFHEKIRKEILDRNIIEYLPEVKTFLSNCTSTSSQNSHSFPFKIPRRYELKHNSDTILKAFNELSELTKNLLLIVQRDIQSRSVIEKRCKALLENVERLNAFASLTGHDKNYYNIVNSNKIQQNKCDTSFHSKPKYFQERINRPQEEYDTIRQHPQKSYGYINVSLSSDDQNLESDGESDCKRILSREHKFNESSRKAGPDEQLQSTYINNAECNGQNYWTESEFEREVIHGTIIDKKVPTEFPFTSNNFPISEESNIIVEDALETLKTTPIQSLEPKQQLNWVTNEMNTSDIKLSPKICSLLNCINPDMPQTNKTTADISKNFETIDKTSNSEIKLPALTYYETQNIKDIYNEPQPETLQTEIRTIHRNIEAARDSHTSQEPLVNCAETALSVYYSRALCIWGFQHSAGLEIEKFYNCQRLLIPRYLYCRTYPDVVFHPYLIYHLFVLQNLTS